MKEMCRGGKGRDSVTPLAEQSACDGADDEAETKSRADHAQAFRATLFVGHIGDVGLCHAQVAACQAV